MSYTRACLKIHSRHLHAPLCGRFGPHSVNVAHYASLIRVKSPTNWNAHLAESNFQTRSSSRWIFSMNLNTLLKNASSPKFSKHNTHVMSLCLTFHVNLGLSLCKTSQALRYLYNISVSHQQIAVICVKPFMDQYLYEKGNVFIADKTHIKICSLKT